MHTYPNPNPTNSLIYIFLWLTFLQSGSIEYESSILFPNAPLYYSVQRFHFPLSVSVIHYMMVFVLAANRISKYFISQCSIVLSFPEVPLPTQCVRYSLYDGVCFGCGCAMVLGVQGWKEKSYAGLVRLPEESTSYW